jgi:hypothetical protein
LWLSGSFFFLRKVTASCRRAFQSPSDECRIPVHIVRQAIVLEITRAAFAMHEGKLTAAVGALGPPVWDRVADLVLDKANEMHRHGFFGAATLSMSGWRVPASRRSSPPWKAPFRSTRRPPEPRRDAPVVRETTLGEVCDHAQRGHRGERRCARDGDPRLSASGKIVHLGCTWGEK